MKPAYFLTITILLFSWSCGLKTEYPAVIDKRVQGKFTNSFEEDQENLLLPPFERDLSGEIPDKIVGNCYFRFARP